MTNSTPKSSLTARLWRETRAARRPFVLTVLFSILGGIVIVVQARLLSAVINEVFLKGASLAVVTAPLLMLLGIIGVRALLAYWGVWASAALAATIKQQLRERLLARLFVFNPIQLTGERSGELVTTLMEGVEKLDGYYREYLPGLLTALLVPVLILLTVLPLDVLTFVVLLVTAPLIPLFMALIGMGAGALAARQFATMQRLSGHFVDVMQGLTTLKLFNRSRGQVNTIQRITEEFRHATMNVLRVAFLSALSLEMLATLSVAIVAVEIGVRLINGGITFESALFLLVIAPEFYQPLRLLGAKFHTGTEGKGAAERIYALLDTPTPEAETAPNVPLVLGDVRLTNVSVRYAPDAPLALADVTLTLPARQHIALVGSSGSGKSTLVALLLGFIAPERGHIDAGDIPLTDLSASQWREQVAWVGQNPVLFNRSIADNIRLGKPDADDAAVIAAAKAAFAHAFITALPDGYATLCGERGLKLSGGQAQRIALARAFLKDAPLLILDEPTSQLDTAAEAEISAALERVCRGRTVLTVAHRLETVRGADWLVVLEDGRVVEQGSPSALLAIGGAYARMIQHSAVGAVPAAAVFTAEPSPTQPTPVPPPPLVPAAEHDPLWRLLRWTQPYAARMGLAVLLGVFTIGSSVALMATSAWMISKAGLRPSIADLGVSVVGVRFFGITRGVFRYLERLLAHDTTFRLLARLRVRFYAALEPLAPARLIDYRSGDLLSRVISDVESLQNIFLRGIAPPLVALMIGLLTCVLLAAFAPILAAAAGAAMLLAGVVVPLWSAARTNSLRETRLRTRANVSAEVLDAMQGMAELHIYGQAQPWRTRLAHALAAFAQSDLRIAQVDGQQTAALTMFSHGAAVAVLALAIPRLDGIFLATVTLATVAAFEAFLPVAQAAVHLGEDRAAARRLYEVIDLPIPVRDPVVPAPTPEEFGLRLRDVTFAYAPGQPPVLEQFSLDVSFGERVAIVGPSGVGKSTLIRLLLRFWEANAGSITLGGRELREYAAEDVRRVIGVLEQGPHLFNTTVRENIRIGRPEATDIEVVEAAQRAQLSSFIESLPEGYATFIGENGTRLSAGQRQRLALARLLLKDSPIIILDEPTASLDSRTELAVMETILEQTSGRTLLLITHRPQLLDRMDRVIHLR